MLKHEEEEKSSRKIRIPHKEKIANRIIISASNFPIVMKYWGIFFPIRNLLFKEAEKEIALKNSKTSTPNVKQKNSVRRSIRHFINPKEEVEILSHRISLKLTDKKYDIDEDKIIAWRNFHFIRRTLGIGFILVLFSLQFDTLIQAEKWYTFPSFMGPIILGIIYLAVLKDSDSLEREKLYNYFKYFFLLFLFSIICTVFLDSWNKRFALVSFNVNTILAGFSFIYFSVFRYSTSKEFTKLDRQQGIFDLILMLFSVVIIPVFFFLMVVYCLTSDLSKLQFINPINFYLIFSNGLIGLIAIIDRFIKIFFKRSAFQKKGYNVSINHFKENRLKNPKSFNIKAIALLLTTVCILVFLRMQEDFHHEVNYVSKEEVATPISFDEYTIQFLNRTALYPDSTIYLIAAEGGGLRAAYWTMLVLEELEKDSSFFFDKSFLMSGASGGAIGQGIYTYLKANELNTNLIDSIGQGNFFTSDLAGIFTRAIVGNIAPFEVMKEYRDRHYFMAKAYIDMIHPTYWDTVSNQPFHKLWNDNQYKLPLIFVNTTKTEDGSRAIVHPLSKENLPTEPYQDLSTNYYGDYISYPHAIFLTNRFPVASPAARIESEGHFVDGGYFENSGLKTLVHTLLFMKARAEVDSNQTYKRFFNRKIKIVNIQNSRDGFISQELKRLSINQDSINRIFPKGELNSIISAAAGGGLTALPSYYNNLLQNNNIQKLLGISFTTISLPHYIPNEIPHEVMYGQIVTDSCRLNQSIQTINDSISNHSSIKVLMPPLGRMLTKPTAKYMQDMLHHQVVSDSIKSTLQ